MKESKFDKAKEEIVEAVKEMGPITGKQLSEYVGVSTATISRAISEIKVIYPSFTSSPKGYYFNSDREKPETDRNHEGYKDPTASDALKNLATKMMKNGIKSDGPMGKATARLVYSQMSSEQKKAVEFFQQDYANTLVQKNIELSDICKQQAERIKELSKTSLSSGNDILERELLRQKAEIYEKAFYALMEVKK